MPQDHTFCFSVPGSPSVAGEGQHAYLLTNCSGLSCSSPQGTTMTSQRALLRTGRLTSYSLRFLNRPRVWGCRKNQHSRVSTEGWPVLMLTCREGIVLEASVYQTLCPSCCPQFHLFSILKPLGCKSHAFPRVLASGHQIQPPLSPLGGPGPGSYCQRGAILTHLSGLW